MTEYKQFTDKQKETLTSYFLNKNLMDKPKQEFVATVNNIFKELNLPLQDTPILISKYPSEVFVDSDKPFNTNNVLWDIKIKDTDLFFVTTRF